MPGRRLRVLHVIQSLNYGGMERLLADIVRRARASRFESHVMALQYLGRFAEGLEDVATLHTADSMPRWSMLWPASLTAQFRQIAPDVVHTHSGVWYKASLAAKHARVPRVIHTEHGRRRPDPFHERTIDFFASRRTDIVVAVSEVLAAQLARTVVADASRVRVVPNGVDVEAYRPRPDTGTIRRELGLSAAAPIIGSVGRLEHIKGYDVMVEAFALLLRDWSEGAPPALVLAGEGAERARLEQLAAERNVRGAIHFLGWRDDIHDQLSAFTLFTMSSRSEGTSVSLLEAMSAGLCPVVTDVGGNAAVLGESLRHRLVAAGDAAALAAAWLAALREPRRRAADGTAARARVVAGFSLDTMVRAYEALYEGRD